MTITRPLIRRLTITRH
ncbi:unnamed protein product [Medioppia subpectinata]|uniref:Uncharacterized protein n=1 Tax=Medioppia subpectinata TaxID=1979941 RepID=A0A7R9LXM7_9ACAR|nr:unnamed protein product [Medioppia subpectinata]CAD7649831.1 unnamed protein product [Medioppia subpectinata]CAG2122617.1 unnamed protein product [Medioppia subpectinata]CAG2122630.1 unnamed protein product [Medioppia subpectinata]